MRLSPDVFRYLVWGAAVVLGIMLAVIDRQVLKRWLLVWLLPAGIAGGLLLTELSPFSFGVTTYYMEGVIIAAGSALALSGYVIAATVLALLFRQPSV